MLVRNARRALTIAMHAMHGLGYAECVRQRARSLSGIGAGSYFVCPPAHTQRRVDELRRTASRKN